MKTDKIIIKYCPHFDFDTPSVIYDIPFLDEQAKCFRYDEGGVGPTPSLCS